MPTWQKPWQGRVYTSSRGHLSYSSIPSPIEGAAKRTLWGCAVQAGSCAVIKCLRAECDLRCAAQFKYTLDFEELVKERRM